MKNFTTEELNRIIQMAWEDRTPFEAIEIQFGIKEKDVIELMKENMKFSSYVMWRKRVKSRPMKHQDKFPEIERRFKSDTQRNMYFHKTKNKNR